MLDLKRIARAEIRILEGTAQEEDYQIYWEWTISPEYRADLEQSAIELEELTGRRFRHLVSKIIAENTNRYNTRPGRPSG